MTDILIRGFEMPTDASLWLMIKPDGTVHKIKAGGKHGEPQQGVAVPLPAGHGRLGDLTEVENKLQETLDGMGDRWLSSPALMAQRVAIVADLKKVKEAPAIIPAEGGDGNG